MEENKEQQDKNLETADSVKADEEAKAKETKTVQDKTETKKSESKVKKEASKKSAESPEQRLMDQPTFAPKAIWQELKKVQWPSFGSLMKSSSLVIVFTVLFGVYFFFCELIASALVSWLVSL